MQGGWRGDKSPFKIPNKTQIPNNKDDTSQLNQNPPHYQQTTAPPHTILTQPASAYFHLPRTPLFSPEPKVHPTRKDICLKNTAQTPIGGNENPQNRPTRTIPPLTNNKLPPNKKPRNAVEGGPERAVREESRKDSEKG